MTTAIVFALSLAFLVFFIWYAAAHQDRRRVQLAILLTLCLGGVSAVSLFRTGTADDAAQYPWPLNIKPGIDISGGTQFTLQLAGNPERSALDQAVEVIRRRVDALGVSEPIIQPVGEGRIQVQIPGVSEQSKLEYRAILERVARLEFRMVHPDNEELLEQIGAGEAVLPFDYEILPFLVENDKTGEREKKTLLVKKRAGMTGKMVKAAYPSYDDMLIPQVALSLSGEGQRTFFEFGKSIIQESAPVPAKMAIVLDGVVYSALGFRDNKPIDSPNVSIDGVSETEARELSTVLENPLETPVSIVDERGVDPTLGKSSVEGGFRAGLIGIALVVVFMAVYYRLAGVFSIIALLFNIFFLLGLLAQFGFTLTLPGVAGIVLTVGIAVDASVLIFERIREELEAGRLLADAVRAGFNKAFSSIIDANLTTLIASVIMFWQGTGAIQGFAVVLSIGILTSLFTALVVTRAGFDTLVSAKRVQTLKMMRILNGAKFPFMAIRTPVMSGSFLLVAVCLGYMGIKGSATLGVDFVGGDLLTLSFQERVPDDQLRAAVGDPSATVQYQAAGEAGGKAYVIVRTAFGQGEAAENQLREAFPQAGFERQSLDKVSGVIGKEFQQKAVIALVAGMLGIFLYVMWRFEWSFALGAIVALVHDVILAMGLFAIMGHQFSLTTVGAILTVGGYSINDTIIIFDRIREGLRQNPKADLTALFNNCINQTLSRTLLTSGTTLLAVLALYAFGGMVIHDFALMLLIGIVVGTYSSIFVASPIVLLLGRKVQQQMASSATAET